MIFLAPGATLSKGLNRGFATLIAGALGVGAQHTAILCGDKGEPIVLGILVFILGILKKKKKNSILDIIFKIKTSILVIILYTYIL